MSDKLDKKSYFKIVIISVIICIIPILSGIIFYDKFPQNIPNRFDFSGNITSYTNKKNILFFLPVIMSIVTVISAIMTYYDPFDKMNTNKNPLLLKIMIFLPAFMSNIFFLGAYLYSVKNINIFSSRLINCFVGFIFIVVGNYLPKNKQNSTLGIRTPWTLKDEVNWNKTNRLGGYIFMLSGVLFIILEFLSRNNKFILIISQAVLIVILFIPVVYSFYLYKKSL